MTWGSYDGFVGERPLPGGAALLALVGVLATRGEPRLAEELQALNAIVRGMPKGEERSALKERRSRLALKFARRGQIALADLVMYVTFGGLILTCVPLSISQMLGREPEEIFTQVVLFVMLVVFTIGAVAFLLGVAGGLIIETSALVRWVVVVAISTPVSPRMRPRP